MSFHRARLAGIPTGRLVRLLLAALLLAFGSVLLGSLAAAAEDAPWLHVRIEDSDEDGETVLVNLPLSVLDAMEDDLDDDFPHKCKIDIADTELSGEEFRAAVKTLEKSPGREVEKRTGSRKVVLKRESDDFVLTATDKRDGERAVIRMPWSVAKALAGGEGSDLDVRSAMLALAAAPGREISVVDDDGTRVRIWVDQKAFTEGDA